MSGIILRWTSISHTNSTNCLWTLGVKQFFLHFASLAEVDTAPDGQEQNVIKYLKTHERSKQKEIDVLLGSASPHPAAFLTDADRGNHLSGRRLAADSVFLENVKMNWMFKLLRQKH